MTLKSVNVVIGAAYGDEGKGLMTDYLADTLANTAAAAASEVVVVRFNGGAQAGHTVVTPNAEHVFHHFGSGTLAGAHTYLSKFFYCNPMLFRKEYLTLDGAYSQSRSWENQTGSIGVGSMRNTNIWADARSPITTPYDMILNQLLERNRGDARHGSCGVGVNETRIRDETCSLTVRDLLASTRISPTAEEGLHSKIKQLRDTYYLDRWNAVLAGTEAFHSAMSILSSEKLLEDFVQHCIFFLDKIKICKPSDLLHAGFDVIFEGAQGLLLDQNHENFPHVTPSSTGIANVLSILKEAQKEYPVEFSFNVYYMHRAYSTRHGAGPFPEAEITPEGLSFNVVDPTNKPNEFQGTLRFGGFDQREYMKRCCKDSDSIKDVFPGAEIALHYAVTCVDQVRSAAAVRFIDELGEARELTGLEYCEHLARTSNILTFGRTRNTVLRLR